MPAVKTGMTPPPMPGMPAPMQPMGGVPPMQNPFAPMPPMPLAGMPPPPMPMPMPMPQGQPMPQAAQGQQMMGSTAGRRRRFGDALEGMLGRNQGIGAVLQQPRPPMAMPQMMPQQRMVAPGTPMMRTPTPRPMADGGIVQYMQGGGAAKPNIKEFMDATGADFQQASQALYGSVGSNIDIRDWDAIMSADDPLRASQAATSQMYSTGAPIATDERFYDDSGAYKPTNVSYGGTDVGASTGGPKLQVTGSGQIMITDSAGLPLTGLSPQNAASFGITQDQIDAAIAAGGNAREGRFAGVGFVPGDYGNLLTDYSNVYGYTPSSSSSSSSSGGGGGGSSSGDVYADSGLSGDVSSGGMVGDIGSSAGSYEMASLYGPNINIPEKVSQYVQNPVTGQITTTAGPVMTAVSPIGAINLPARPAELDIFDYLGDPTYGSLLDKQVEGMAQGGAVPRQTMIGDQPHMLAYINPQEADLLKDLGGTGEPGPGGIPAYRDLDADMYAGSKYGPTSNAGTSSASQSFTNVHTGETFSSASDLHDSYGFDDDDNNSSSGSVNTSAKDADLGVGGSDKTVTASDLSSGTGTTTYDTDDGGSVTVATGSTIDDILNTASSGGGGGGGGGSSVVEVYAPSSVYTPPTYTDRLGREYGSQALADAANRMLDYTSLQNQVVNDARDKVATEFADRGLSQTQEDIDYYTMDRLRNLEGDAPFTYAGIGGIGAGPESGSLITPQPVIDPDVGTSQAPNIFDITPDTVPGLENAINLNAPVSPPDDDDDYTPTAAEMAAQLAAQGQTNVTQGPMSVAEQTAALQERYGQFTPDQYDAETLDSDDYSAEGAMDLMDMEGDLAGVILPEDTGGLRRTSASPATDDDKPAASTQTASSTTSQDLNKGLGAPTAKQLTDEEAAKLKATYGLEARGLKPGDDLRRANIAVNAAEAKYLQNLLKEFEFDKNDKMVLKDPNAAEKVLGQVIKNLTLGIVDVNDLNQERVQAVLDAYRDTGSFVYDTEGNAIDLKTVEDLEKLEKLSAGRGQEPAVIGVRDKDGNVVSFGPDIKNTMEGPVAVDVFSEMSTTTGDDDDTTTTTTDDTGHKDGVCNNPDYVYNPETDKCEPKAEETDGDLGSPITTAITPRSFDEVLRSVVVPAPDIAPISANIRPMQAGGMVGLNRAADNFIKALAG